MATIRQNLTSNQPITIALASLANGGSVVSSAIDNTTNLFIGADLQLHYTTGSGVSGSGTVDLYLLRSLDGIGSTFDTPDPTTATLITSFAAFGVSTSYVVSSSIQVLPSQWKIMVVNNTGAALGGSASVIFEGKKLDIV
jgi:secreted protein with Ig-like and vWFA domain